MVDERSGEAKRRGGAGPVNDGEEAAEPMFEVDARIGDLDLDNDEEAGRDADTYCEPLGSVFAIFISHANEVAGVGDRDMLPAILTDS